MSFTGTAQSDACMYYVFNCFRYPFSHAVFRGTDARNGALSHISRWPEEVVRLYVCEQESQGCTWILCFPFV